MTALPAASAPWYFDGFVSPGWFDYIGALLAVAGFVVALDQLRKTRSSAKAATDALEAAQARLVSTTLQTMASQFQLVASDLDHAMEIDSKDVARQALVRFAHLAQETRTLLTEDIQGHDGLKIRLNSSSEMALDVKERITQSAGVAVSKMAKKVSREISALSIEMTGVGASLRHTVEGANDV